MMMMMMIIIIIIIIIISIFVKRHNVVTSDLHQLHHLPSDSDHYHNQSAIEPISTELSTRQHVSLVSQTCC